MDLAEDSSEDLNILAYLDCHIHERGYSNSIEPAHGREGSFDFLLVTQRAYGQFMNTGPSWGEEVL